VRLQLTDMIAKRESMRHSPVTHSMQTCRQEPDALAAAGAGHLRLRFRQALALGQLPAAWAAAALLVERGVWRALGDAALHALDVDLAVRCLVMTSLPIVARLLNRGPGSSCITAARKQARQHM